MAPELIDDLDKITAVASDERLDGVFIPSTSGVASIKANGFEVGADHDIRFHGEPVDDRIQRASQDINKAYKLLDNLENLVGALYGIEDIREEMIENIRAEVSRSQHGFDKEPVVISDRDIELSFRDDYIPDFNERINKVMAQKAGMEKTGEGQIHNKDTLR